MAWFELPGRRGQKEKHYYDSVANRYRGVFTIHDQHYRDDANQWQGIDETLIDDTGGFDKKCDKTRHAFRVASGGSHRWYPRRNVATEYVEITGIEYWRTTGGGSWRNLTLPTPVWKSQGASWDMANLYAEIINTWRKVETSFILKDATAPTRLRFAITLVGLTLNTTTWELTSTTDGLVWGTIIPPVAWYGNTEREIGTPLTVTTTYAGGYLEWSVNTTGATYPIYIDPTFQDGAGGGVNTNMDAHITDAADDNGYGTTTTINVGGESTGTVDRVRGLVQFNVSSITGVTVSSGTLTLYFVSEANTTDRNIGAHKGLVQWWEPSVSGTTIPGGEDGSTWGHRNINGDVHWGAVGGQSGTDYTATATDTKTIATPDTLYDYTVTTDVASWVGGTTTNYGWWLINTDEGVIDSRKRFTSSDGATEANRPKLVVEYQESGVTIQLGIA